MCVTFEDELARTLFHDAIINFRTMVERDGLPVAEATARATTNAGLGLNQIVQFEREVAMRYLAARAE